MTVNGEYLAAQTLEFWRISSIRLGRIDDNLTTEKALQRSAYILQHLGPHRFLEHLISRLYDDIIINRRTKKPEVPINPTNVMLMPKKRSKRSRTIDNQRHQES